MTEQEMRQRISQQYDSFREIEYWPLKDIVMPLKTQFWERGLKERVL